MAFLKQVDDNLIEVRIPLDKECIIVGREGGCDVQVEFPAVSRSHAQITQESSKFFLQDLNSRNGTKLNGEKISSKELLKHGDKIEFSTKEFIFYSLDGLNEQTGSGLITPRMIPSSGRAEDSDDASIMREFRKIGDDVEPSPFVAKELRESKIIACFPAQTDQLNPLIARVAPSKLLQVLQLMDALRRIRNREEVFEAAASKMQEFFPSMERIAFVEETDSSHRIRVIFAGGRVPDSSSELCIPLIQRTIRDSDALLYAEQRRKSVTDVPRISDLSNCYIMCVPVLEANGVCCGAIQMDCSDDERGFDAVDLERLTILTHVIAFALEHCDDRVTGC